MRHRVTKHHFGRRTGPRKALIRGLVSSLVEHGRITTTLAKAKELRRHVEKAVTVGKKGGVHANRTLLSKYPNSDTVSTIVNDLSKRFADRPGGYTRILKTGNRPGDNAPMAIIEFVDYNPADVDNSSSVVEYKVAKKRVDQKRKTLRKIQSESRRINRQNA
tara:strand:- start:83 stop:568 length:486 start_codon:yes stop_codon:yes gene_type:complete